MKVLYIAPENTVGTLSLWKQAHESRGNECTFITLYHTTHDYDPGICLDLPLVKASPWYMKSRHRYYQLARGAEGDYREKDGYPPVWTPNSTPEKWYFQFRDWLWSFKVEPAIEALRLFDYDVYHLDWGLEFYRDGRFVKKLKEAGKPIICTYHGQDLRTRGVIAIIDKASSLNVTSELDLMQKHPDLEYLFLPYDTSRHGQPQTVNHPIRICHSPTNRYYKGSETIIPICEKLAKDENIEFVLIENMPHDKAQHVKQSCDILIDQVHNRGGWGYGMNSVEALSMGLCCVTELIPQYVDFIPDHPFVNVTGDVLYETLLELIENPNKIMEFKKRGRKWVVKYHDLHNTTDVLYNYYEKRGII
ncbi:MAG: glycosyltransferase [Candidatus Marinimicrobia bacterium]|nr:glycosyltransferase [Candidatus Neomarinimicrobiota bacterium]MCH7762343.1 glycosyltransferase [Candidatus Neomarinimicrobiota bacterium]